MDFIKKKKINKWVMIALLYVAFAFAYYVPMRGTVSLMTLKYGLPSFVNNDIVAFITAGMVPTLMYEIITSFGFGFLRTRGVLNSEDMRYALRFFYTLAAFVIGGIKLIFLLFPLGQIFGFTLVDLLVPIPFFALYMWYVLDSYADKTKYASLIYLLGGTFTIIYAAIAVLDLITGALQ